jgi:cell volume regulation protein A
MLAETCGLPLPAERWSWTLRDLFAREYRRPDIGDRLTVGAVELVVRTLDEAGAKDVGLVLEPVPMKPPPFILSWPTALYRRLFHRLTLALQQSWRRDK